MTKKELRKNLLIKRDSLRDISLNIIRHIKETKILDGFKRIGIYYPLKGEINLLSLIDIYPDKEFCFPKTMEEIAFYHENNISNFHKAKFNVLEPNSNILVERDSIDVFLIPCVGITYNNKRIGYGKGYYDRYLDGYKGMKIGICYKELSNLDFECDEWDLVLDKVIVG